MSRKLLFSIPLAFFALKSTQVDIQNKNGPANILLNILGRAIPFSLIQCASSVGRKIELPRAISPFEESILVIRDQKSAKALSHGVFLTSSGHFLTLLSPFIEKDSAQLKPGDSFPYSVSDINGQKTHQLVVDTILQEENLLILRKEKNETKSKPVLLDLDPQTGSKCIKIQGGSLNLVNLGVINNKQVIVSNVEGLNEIELPFVSILASFMGEEESIESYGAPVFDESSGKLIGLVYPVKEKPPILGGAKCLLPAGFLKGIQDQLETRKNQEEGIRRGHFGMGLLNTNEKDSVFVVSVTPNGPAARVGIKIGENITEIDGQPVKSTNDFKRITGFDLKKKFELEVTNGKKYRKVSFDFGL